MSRDTSEKEDMDYESQSPKSDPEQCSDTEKELNHGLSTQEDINPTKSEEQDTCVSSTPELSNKTDIPIPELILTPGTKQYFDEKLKYCVKPDEIPQEYQEPTYYYLLYRELHFRTYDYMKVQYLTPQMRAIVIDWMVDVHFKLKMPHEILYLAIKLFDMYLSRVMFPFTQLELLGGTCLFIASKFEKILPYDINVFVAHCHYIWPKEYMRNLELEVLSRLEFDINAPTSFSFLKYYAYRFKISKCTFTFACFVLEYSTMDYATSLFKDSELAAAALFYTLLAFEGFRWNTELEEITHYKIEELVNAVYVISMALKRPESLRLQKIRYKYSLEDYYDITQYFYAMLVDYN